MEDNDDDEDEDDVLGGDGGGGGGFASPSARRCARRSFLRSWRRLSASVLISTDKPRSDATDLLFRVWRARRAFFAVFSRWKTFFSAAVLGRRFFSRRSRRSFPSRRRSLRPAWCFFHWPRRPWFPFSSRRCFGPSSRRADSLGIFQALRRRFSSAAGIFGCGASFTSGRGRS